MRRGCIQDLDSHDATECLENINTCKSCQETNCNLKTKFHECYICDSKNDPNCTRARDADHSTGIETCKTFSSNCAVGVDRNGYTHRRCGDAFPATNEFLHYVTCDGDKCNGEIFPNDRLKCFQCDDEEGCDEMSLNSLKPEPCSILSDYNQCFTYIDFHFEIDQKKKMFNRTFYRGCSSDSTNIRLLCDLDGEKKRGKCIKCSNSGCNSKRWEEIKNSSAKEFASFPLCSLFILIVYVLHID